MKIIQIIASWFTQPEKNAAGRLGLYRIIYALFYLWYISHQDCARLSGVPKDMLRARGIIGWVPAELSPFFFQVLECSLVAALVVLMFGYRTRCITGIVLVVGMFLEALVSRFGGQHGPVFVSSFIPFFMLLNGRWGHTYSIDSMIAQREGQPPVEPANSSWHYALPAKCLLVILATLFTSAGLYKICVGGTWLSNPDLMAMLMIDKNVISAKYGLPMNALAPFIAEHMFLARSLQYFIVLFEGTFLLALTNRRLFRIYIAMALIFHAFNALWFAVTFTSLLVLYLLYVDWQRVLEWIQAKQVRCPNIRPTILLAIALGLALGLGLLWNFGHVARSLFNGFGLIDWRTIWYPVLPIAILALGKELRPRMGADKADI